MGFQERVGAEAGPWVVFGLYDEAASDRVAVDVAELFDSFGGGDDVEVVIAGSKKGFSGCRLDTSRLSTARARLRGLTGGSEMRRWMCSGMMT